MTGCAGSMVNVRRCDTVRVPEGWCGASVEAWNGRRGQGVMTGPVCEECEKLSRGAEGKRARLTMNEGSLHSSLDGGGDAVRGQVVRDVDHRPRPGRATEPPLSSVCRHRVKMSSFFFVLAGVFISASSLPTGHFTVFLQDTSQSSDSTLHSLPTGHFTVFRQG